MVKQPRYLVKQDRDEADRPDGWFVEDSATGQAFAFFNHKFQAERSAANFERSAA